MKLFRIGIMIEEQFGDSFSSIFDIRKVCKNRESLEKTIKHFNKEIEGFLKENGFIQKK